MGLDVAGTDVIVIFQGGVKHCFGCVQVELMALSGLGQGFIVSQASCSLP